MFNFYALASDVSSTSLSQMIENAQSGLGGIFNAILVIAGIVLIFYGGILIFKALMGQQGGNSHWIKAAACIVIGGFLASSGYTNLRNVSNVGTGTVQALTGQKGK